MSVLCIFIMYIYKDTHIQYIYGENIYMCIYIYIFILLKIYLIYKHIIFFLHKYNMFFLNIYMHVFVFI